MRTPPVFTLGTLVLAAALATPASASDPRASAIVDSALTTLGGRLRLEAFASWEVAGKGRENLTAEVQGIAPDVPTWRPHEEQLTVETRSLWVAWQRKTPRNDQSLRWRRLIYRSDSSGFVDFVVGSGVLRPSSASELRRRSLARRVPHLLVLEVATRAEVLDRGPVTIGRRPGDQVAAILDGDTLLLSFSRSPVLLRRVEFHRSQPTRGDVAIAWSWDDWSKDPYLGYVPQGHRVDVGGTLFQTVRYSLYEAPARDARSRMGVADARMYWKPPKPRANANDNAHSEIVAIQPDSGEVARGVHVGRFAGFTVMWVEFQDYLVAVEAPDASPGLEAIPPERPAARPTDDFVARLRAQFPNKPVRYVVISHHHGDHMGGIRAFAALGATVIVAPGHRAAALRALAGTGSVETVAERREITDGTRTLQILNVRRNPHTDDNLLVWLPVERIAFQGDLFYDDDPFNFPPSGRGTMNRFTAEWLRDHGIAPLLVYGVHNERPSGPERLGEALQLSK